MRLLSSQKVVLTTITPTGSQTIRTLTGLEHCSRVEILPFSAPATLTDSFTGSTAVLDHQTKWRFDVGNNFLTRFKLSSSNDIAIFVYSDK